MLKRSRNSVLQSFLNYAAIASTKEKNTKQVYQAQNFFIPKRTRDPKRPDQLKTLQ